MRDAHLRSHTRRPLVGNAAEVLEEELDTVTAQQCTCRRPAICIARRKKSDLVPTYPLPAELMGKGVSCRP